MDTIAQREELEPTPEVFHPWYRGGSVEMEMLIVFTGLDTRGVGWREAFHGLYTRTTPSSLH